MSGGRGSKGAGRAGAGTSRGPADWDRRLIEEQLRGYARRRERDPMGKRALFSAATPRPSPLGTLALECSSCKRESPVRLRDLPRLSFPLVVHLPRRYHSLMKCPACGRRTWMRAHWRV
ncbi:MAG: hypothetical protein HY775_06260 [Acidobacteria bacterium]|nr:hypothetical protein [Acidobacteriota bacterium]